MSDHVKLFERIAYGGVAFDLLSTLMYSKQNVVDVVITSAILAFLVQMTARRADRCAPWLFLAVASLGILINIGSDFWLWGPAWMQGYLKPETPPPHIKRALDVVGSLLLFVAAFYFYVTRRNVQKSDPVAAG